MWFNELLHHIIRPKLYDTAKWLLNNKLKKEGIEKKNTHKVAIEFEFTIANGNNSNSISWGKLTVITEIEPSLLFYRENQKEGSSLIEQRARDRIKELIHTSEDNQFDIKILSVSLV